MHMIKRKNKVGSDCNAIKLISDLLPIHTLDFNYRKRDGERGRDQGGGNGKRVGKRTQRKTFKS